MTELLSAEHMFIADPSVFTVEKLLRKRKRHGSFEYLVKWRDYNFRFNTWEPESNILDQRLLDEFEDRCRNSGDLFIKEDVYDTEMSDTENNERIANRRSAPVVRSTAKRTKKKRTTRSSFKLRGSREKRAPVVKYEEIEDEVEEKLSDEEEDLEEGEKKEEKEEEVKEELTLEEEEEKEEEAPESSVSDQEAGSSAASPVRNLRNKKVAKPISLTAAKKRTPSSKFSSLMKRSRKQAQSYGMQFSRKELSNTSVSPTASSAKLSSEDGDDQVGSDEPTSVKIVKTKEQPKQKKKRAVILSEESGDSGKRQKNGSEEGGDEELNMKRKRPARSCAVPSGFWDPVAVKIDSGIDSHSENEDHSIKEEDIIRAQRRMKNFEPAPSNHETCYTETPTESTNGCINDLGDSVFPKKKFCLRPPTLDLSKRPISDFVFKIDDLWADKVHESSVKALGYSVKIFECKSAKTLFSNSKKSTKLKTEESNQEQLGT